MSIKKYAAFFDFDGTLIRGDSQEMELLHTIRYGYQRWSNILRISGTVIAAILSHFGLISALCQNRIYITTYRGLTSEDAARIGENIFQSQIRMMFIHQTVELMEKHRDEGALIIIVSAATSHILEPAKKYIRPDHILCTNLETDSKGKFTGRPLGNICIGEEKVRRIRELALRHGIDLAGSFAYSDHHSDIPLLETAGNPVVINPTVILERIASKRNWPVYRFRETFCP